MNWTLEGKIYVAGGINKSQNRLFDIVCIENGVEKWQRELPFPLLFSSCSVLNGLVYFFGGRVSPQQPRNDFFCLNAQAELQTISSSNLPGKRWSHSLTSDGKRLVLIGGRDQNSVMDSIFSWETQKGAFLIGV